MAKKGTDNLVPMNQRSKDEARELGRKGGQASGRARRKKADFAKAFDGLLTSKTTDEELKAELDELGFEDTNEMAVALSVTKRAMAGDPIAFDKVSKYVKNNTKSDLDKRQQKEQIKRLRLENERLQQQLDEQKRQYEIDDLETARTEMKQHIYDMVGDYMNRLDDWLQNNS